MRSSYMRQLPATRPAVGRRRPPWTTRVRMMATVPEGGPLADACRRWRASFVNHVLIGDVPIEIVRGVDLLPEVRSARRVRARWTGLGDRHKSPTIEVPKDLRFRTRSRSKINALTFDARSTCSSRNQVGCVGGNERDVRLNGLNRMNR